MSALRNALGANADMAMVFLVVAILTVLFAPIPATLLDFLIIANFSFAMLILLLTFYIGRPVEFSTFPSLLLVATLFRLSLNVAATRLILGHGDAGQVIGAVGAYVVGGNYVIGLIVFLILVVVQFVVVTSGAQRVSEVAARFMLDSMPGQQMSIDADLNMGFIDQAEAQRRRQDLSKEAAFYGAMDGASKFVKGDAIAGIVILLINIVGGLVVGVMQRGMRWGDALQTFTLLTIGDGIVTQVPALVISVGTGLIVTRSASGGNLGHQAVAQITAFPKTLWMVLLSLAGLLVFPGIPSLPVLVVMGVVLLVVYGRRKLQDAADTPDEPGAAGRTAESAKDDADYAALRVEPIEVHLGAHLAPFLGAERATLKERMVAFRKQFALESGFVAPGVHFRDGARVPADGYEICIFGVVAARGELFPDRTLAIRTSTQARKLNGIEGVEPAFGLPAVWIEDDEKEAARAAKYTLVDPTTALVTHISEVIRDQSPQLLTRREMDALVQPLRERQPGLVEDLVPTQLALADVQRVLQNLLRERVSIRHIESIIETLSEHAKSTKDTTVLTELVRQRLGAIICQPLTRSDGTLNVLTLDAAVEQKLSQGLRDAAESGAGNIVIDPRLAEQLLSRLLQQCESMAQRSLMPVLLCAPDLRRHLRALSERVAPQLHVLSLAEVPRAANLRAFGSVAI
ncbi:flagellar biosynthesis protein FlhA [Aquabacterium humicola]|uniref:flagellar biosynthesis protein FlhA n=1 Tax=Aquabacterium humicola TaxID=3237377 RepID=UPI002542FC85|nr:flagellar biosynthesis protein FlhA [Rubrivivax pictus]